MKHIRMIMPLLLLFTLTLSLAGQQKIKISVYPFENKSDSSYAWMQYGLSYLLKESLSRMDTLETVSMEDVFTATTDANINLANLYQGVITPTFAKYQMDWNAPYALFGNYAVEGDTVMVVEYRFCSLAQKAMTQPQKVRGRIQQYTDMYLTHIKLIDDIYTKLILTFDWPLTRPMLENAEAAVRKIAVDYDAYRAMIRNWLAIQNYDAGLRFSENGDYTASIEYFKRSLYYDDQKTLNTDVNLSKAYVLSGNVFYQNKDWDAAETAYKNAFMYYETNGEAYYNLGNVYKEKQAWDLSLEQYNKALQIDSDNVDAYINIGYVNSAKLLFSEAIAAYEQAIFYSPNNAMAYYFAGTAYDNSNQINKAREYYLKALLLDSTIAGAHLNLGIILKQQKDLKGARLRYESALTYDPNNAAAHRNLGILLMGNKKEAKQALYHLEKCIELDPNQDDAAAIKKNIGILSKRVKGKKK